ncbi:DUF397 domain-containing protein [Streptomyces sp. NPDC058735]|uniref:DUF397 domain-containing protein n=1 Tax=unclassified Streptomyces TaxID=2593676 RepID=UPI0036A82603
MTTELDWFKSSYSSNDGPACLEAALSPSPQLAVHIRDSKHKDGARLTFAGGPWSEFLEFATGS